MCCQSIFILSFPRRRSQACWHVDENLADRPVAVVIASSEFLRSAGMKKKSWSEPELIVLVRGTPEEAVLSACKYTTGSNVSTTYLGCMDSPILACAQPCLDYLIS